LYECDEANEKNTASSDRVVCARRKGLLEQAKKVTTGVRSHKQERKRGGPIADAPDLCGAFERRVIYGLEIPTGNDACDKDGVKTYRPAESATRLMAKAARPGNDAVCLALDAQRSGLARLVTPPSI
jgi:hypothetical protein